MAPELTLTGILKFKHSRPFDKEKASQQVPQILLFVMFFRANPLAAFAL
jgi:hypothetical protein